MTDLQIAINNLDGHTVCLCKDGQCLVSDKKGIAPMMGFIAEGRDLRGYSVVDLVVGKAAALLFAKCGITQVFARVLSQKGQKVLQNFGISYSYGTLTDKILNRDGTDVCPMEKTVANTDDPDEAYLLLAQKIRAMQAANGR